MSGLEWGMNAFVKSGPPWCGNSMWRDRQSVQRYGRWDREKGQYQAPNEHAMLKLLETGLWCPTAVAQHKEQFVEYLYVRKRERDAKDEKQRAEQDAKAKASVVAKMRREKEEELEREVKKAREDKMTALSKNHQLRRDLGVIEDQPEIVKEIFDMYGVTADQIAVSGKIADLGPRSGMSDAERVRRAFRLGGGIVPHTQLRKLLADFASLP